MKKRRRTDLKEAESEQGSIAQVVSLRDSDQIQVMDPKGGNSLALFPAKFPMRMCIRRGERRKRRRYMCEIPSDLCQQNSFGSLPAKSMVRFKCFSKQWSSLISCRYFCNRIFNTVTRQQQPHMYMCLVDDGGKRVLLSISSSTPSPDNNNTCYVVDQDLSITGMGGFFLNLVRGLMCFSVRKKACIYNPSTRQRLTLPAIKSHIIAQQGGDQRKDIRYYIGHDPCNDQYKIVCTVAISSAFFGNVRSEHWVFVLEAGGSWKKVVRPKNYHPHAPSTVGHFLNGSVVYYMAWVDMETCAVVSFDITSEELTTILVPQEAGDVALPAARMKTGLIEYGGKIAIFDHTHLQDKCLVDLWVLKDAGKMKWKKKRLFLQPCQKHLVHELTLIVKGTTRDGKVILAPVEMHSQFFIFFYDMKSNDLSKVEIKGVPHIWFDKDCYFDLKYSMDESEDVIYLDT
ncbi:PREDICTED: F-box protein At2g40910-like isoform X2 [Camelina sativa]|uniref:F-box protein At2g40910-like isoform X2 n=2 Tax=Camelina sativa TaxID=90675 RepID=A0ABM1RNJ1_CAMSA|nr:PREDICTED: F-box protein At2g40910-like isoform X2 [Camelina sativa]